MRRTKWKTLIITLLLIIGTGAGGSYVYLQNLYQEYLTQPVDTESTARVNFTVEKGETGATIAEKLADLNLVPSEWAFYKYIRDEEIAPNIEAGKFVLKKSYTIPEIAEFLTKSKTDEVVLTIREGLTIQQVDSYLSENKVLAAGSFEKCAKECPFTPSRFLDSKPKDQSLEGYLFADTYFVDPETVTPKTWWNAC